MQEIITRTYDGLRAHRCLCLTSLLMLTAALALALSRQHYKEDITDFLPLDSRNEQAMKVLQELSGASRIVAIVSLTDSGGQPLKTAQPQGSARQATKPQQLLTDAVDRFIDIVQQRDTTGIAETMQTAAGMDQIEQVMRLAYAHMPLFLAEADYARMDSLLALPDYMPAQLAADKQKLLLPMSGLVAQSVACDPLNFFPSMTEALQQRQAMTGFAECDGYLFTPDTSRAVVMMTSPYGGSETSSNARLLGFLQDCAEEVGSAAVEIRFTGPPVIAVGNAAQIKKDSLLAMSMALVLIAGLLFAVFRSVKSMALIVVSTAWGWLFAMGMLALLRNSVSLIVIGISSVIIGIAVNYPLHLMAHLRHTPSVRQALREIAIPLLVGNITTVGAFMALLPLQSVALSDLGLFSALLLVGTISFVLIFLPQLMAGRPSPEAREGGRGTSAVGRHVAVTTERLRRFSSHLGRGASLLFVAITVILGYLSLGTTFDSSLAGINYVDPRQRQDLEALSALSPGEDWHRLLPSLQQQERRLALWRDFADRHGSQIEAGVRQAARDEGFAEDTFDPFLRLLHDEPQPMDFFDPGSIATRLSSDFNYIGLACSLIVFLFLWFSFGSLELAVLSFLPMAVSWLWILGTMALLDIHFNVVNIILATFIFGQGDDYTIFMTEGCQYEYAYRRPMLASYRKSITLSALIMLTGIGTLIVARHPALRSLAQVTIVGMFSVVLMAWLLPPFIFRWLVADRHGFRRRPLSLALLWRRLRGEKPGTPDYYRHLVGDRYRYKGIAITAAVRRGLRPATMATPLILPDAPSIAVVNSGYGEKALLLALLNPTATVFAIEADDDKRLVARHSAGQLAPNMVCMKKEGREQVQQLQTNHPGIKIIQL